MAVDYDLPEITERAANGAALLDEMEPNWFHDIDTTFLNLRDATQCVLGQLYGHYDSGLEKLGLRSLADGRMYGFDLYFHEGMANKWVPLKAAWVAEIQKRMELAA